MSVSPVVGGLFSGSATATHLGGVPGGRSRECVWRAVKQISFSMIDDANRRRPANYAEELCCLARVPATLQTGRRRNPCRGSPSLGLDRASWFPIPGDR